MNGYLWIKSLHIIAVISWMAGLLYLPRLFVYHSVEPARSASSDLFGLMELRLFKFIMTPAMIVVWFSGVWLGFWSGFWFEGWFIVKLLFVAGMTGFHFFLGWERHIFESDTQRRSQKFYRILNEVPTLLMVGIVILVVVKPF